MNPKYLRIFLKNLFFSLSSKKFKKRGEGSNPNLMRIFFLVKFGHFPIKRGGGPDQNPNFFRYFFLFDIRLEKEFLEHVKSYKGAGSRRFSKNPK